MSVKRYLLGVIGLAALVAGGFVFDAGQGYSSNWMRWFFGPLLWFVGGALIIGWVAGMAFAKRIETYTGVERRKSASGGANRAA